MNKKACLFSLLFFLFSIHCVYEPSLLELAIKKATKTGDSTWLTHLLENRTAAPLLYDAAKHGHLSTFFISCAYKHRCITSRKQQKIILKRLILSGNPQNVEISFDENLLKPETIDADVLDFALQRTYFYSKNKHIYDFLKRKQISTQNIHVKKRKRESEDAPSEELEAIAKKTKYQQTACQVCLEDFTLEEITPLYTLPCKHVFHPECTQEWFKAIKQKQCPLCKDTNGKPAPPLRDRNAPFHVNWTRFEWGQRSLSLPAPLD